MKDRITQFPHRYQLVPVSGQTDTYDIVAKPGTISEAGTPINKASLLKDETANLYGLEGQDKTVNEALRKIKDKTVVTITNTTTWTVPAGVTEIDIFVLNGGENGGRGGTASPFSVAGNGGLGGGGSGAGSGGYAGGGGGGSGQALLLYGLRVVPLSSHAVIVGSGGGGISSFDGMFFKSNFSEVEGATGESGEGSTNGGKSGAGGGGEGKTASQEPGKKGGDVVYKGVHSSSGFIVCPFNGEKYGYPGAGGAGTLGRGGDCLGYLGGAPYQETSGGVAGGGVAGGGAAYGNNGQSGSANLFAEGTGAKGGDATVYGSGGGGGGAGFSAYGTPFTSGAGGAGYQGAVIIRY